MKKIILLVFISLLITFCGKTVEPNTNFNRPTDVEAECNYLQEVTLSWNYDNDDAEEFLIRRKAEDDPYTIIDTVAADIFEFEDLQVNVNNTYYYMVAAVFETYQGEWSDEQSVYINPGFQSLEFATD